MNKLKSFTVYITFIFLFNFVSGLFAAENRDLQYQRPADLRGVSTFEPGKDNKVEYQGYKVLVGGASTLQFQGINHQNNAAIIKDDDGVNTNELVELGNNLNLATANLDINVQLEKGVRMHLRTFLSSRHHHEAWVEGGYLQIDRLDFIKKDFLKPVMDIVSLKIGHMENNYGDAHFRRSSNGQAIFNPFVGNYLMDSYTTEVGGELYAYKYGGLAMVGFTNGKLNQDVTSPDKTLPSILGKLGYDNYVTDDLRVRTTASLYTNKRMNRTYLYSGDRSGARYYSIMENVTATRDDFRTPRWNPGFADKLTAMMFNGMIKWQGLELFGLYETATGGDFPGAEETRTVNQVAGDAVYRFGPNEQLYVALRFNNVNGKISNTDANKISIDRYQAAAGWFLTKNILAKVEYVKQDYKDFNRTNKLAGGTFGGIVMESTISF